MSDLAEAGPGAVAIAAMEHAGKIVSALLVEESPDSLAFEAASALARILAPVPDLILRQQTYIERLEGANSALHVQFGEEQLEREALVEAMGSALGELGEYFRQANHLRGRGTPRAIPRTLTDNTPRFTTHPVAGTAAPFASEVSTHIIGG
jgi:hypothetical protein